MELILILLSILFAGLTVCKIYAKIDFILMSVMSISIFFSAYVIVSAFLFVLDVFSIIRALLSSLMLILAVFTVLFLKNKTKFSTVSFIPREYIVPLIILILSLPVCWNSFGFWGMGQDEGVYQTQAVEIIHGASGSWTEFDEYKSLTTEVEKKHYKEVVKSLTGLYFYDPATRFPEGISRFVESRNTDSVKLYGNYHGIPTYPAILALWGKIYGIEEMNRVQILFYVCFIVFVFFVCRNLKFNTATTILVLSISAFSPVVMWVIKSTLTEGFLALLISWFVFHMTDEENKDKKIIASFPVVVFAFFHVTIYTMIPIFIASFFFMYTWDRDRQFLIGALISAVGFCVGYTIMFFLGTQYTFDNSRHLMLGKNVIYIFAPVVMLVTMATSKFISTSAVFNLIIKFRQSKKFDLLFQIVLIICLVAVGFYGYRVGNSIILPDREFQTYYGKGLMTALQYSCLFSFIYSTGLLIVPLSLFCILTRFKKMKQDKNSLFILLMFFYCVIFMSAFLRKEIPYYYYYARYLVPFIPIAAFTAGIALRNVSYKLVGVICFSTILFFTPYNIFLYKNSIDVTKVPLNTFDDTLNVVKKLKKGAILIDAEERDHLNNFYMAWFLPLRAISGGAVFSRFSDINIEDQVGFLLETYGHVYVATNKTSLDYLKEKQLLYRNKYEASTYTLANPGFDKNTTGWRSLVPFPLSFREDENMISIYKIEPFSNFCSFNDKSLNTEGFHGAERSGHAWSAEETVRSYHRLKNSDYFMVVSFAPYIPFEKLSLKNYQIATYMNNINIGTIKLAPGADSKVKLFIPQELIYDGGVLKEQTITFVSDLWSPTQYGEKDDRKLGFALRSLEFLPDSDYKFGEILFLNEKSNENVLAKDSWYAPENWGVWGIGQNHKLKIPLVESIQSNLNLTIEATVFNRQRSVKIFINGHNIGNLLISSDKITSYTIQVDKTLFSGADEMDIVFELDGKSRSPQELGISADSRKLGLGLVSLQIEKITDGNDNN